MATMKKRKKKIGEREIETKGEECQLFHMDKLVVFWSIKHTEMTPSTEIT